MTDLLIQCFMYYDSCMAAVFLEVIFSMMMLIPMISMISMMLLLMTRMVILSLKLLGIKIGLLTCDLYFAKTEKIRIQKHFWNNKKILITGSSRGARCHAKRLKSAVNLYDSYATLSRSSSSVGESSPPARSRELGHKVTSPTVSWVTLNSS